MVYDTIFEKSNCFNHDSASLYLVMSERIKWLVEISDWGLPKYIGGVTMMSLFHIINKLVIVVTKCDKFFH